MNKGKKECTFLWFIENYSYCWHENGAPLFSPEFTFDVLEGTAWKLALNPKGYRAQDRGNISLLLCRKANDAGLEDFTIKLEFSLLAADGSAIHSRNFEGTVPRNRGSGYYQFAQTDEIHLRRKDEYLPNDTLSVRCKMWKGDGDVQKAKQVSARTRIISEHISFPLTLERFSTLQPNVRKTIKIQSHLVEGNVVSCSLYYTVGSCGEEKIIIELVPSGAMQFLHKCKLSLLGASENIIYCGGIDYAYDVERIGIHKLPLYLTREVVLNRKSDYLRNDKFSLLCECTFTTGLRFHTIGDQHDLPLAVIKQKSNPANNKDVDKSSEKISEYPSVSEDMKAIYINQRLTDVELRTKTKSFPAHKIVLCARSPVFEAMMTSDMKEKITACIQVDDLENDTVQQLLLFLYSDNLETLQWNSATQLYYAADKYQIGKLKAMCSSFLAENLNISNTSELLLLSDTHNDSNLMKIVEDFILKHEDQVYSSNGWEKLKETNPQLVIKTMCLKYKRKNEVN